MVTIYLDGVIDEVASCDRSYTVVYSTRQPGLKRCGVTVLLVLIYPRITCEHRRPNQPVVASANTVRNSHMIITTRYHVEGTVAKGNHTLVDFQPLVVGQSDVSSVPTLQISGPQPQILGRSHSVATSVLLLRSCDLSHGNIRKR